MFQLTDGLVQLREWREADLLPLGEMSADPIVRRYFPNVLNAEESRQKAQRQRDHIAEHGFGFWVLAVPGVTEFAGYVGLQRTRWPVHFAPCVEIGWSLLPAFWGKGYAIAGARLALRFGFEQLALHEIVALTVEGNLPSCRLMERLGMVHDPVDDFDHPAVAADHPLCRHVLYRLRKEVWRTQMPAE